MINGRIKFVEPIMCVLIFSTNLSEIFLILRKIQRDIILNLRRSSCQVPVIIVRFERNLKFLDIPKYLFS